MIKSLLKNISYTFGVINLLSLTSLLLATPSQALDLFGDAFLTPEGNSLFLSNNSRQSREDAALGNFITNEYNLSDIAALDAFTLETELGLPDGFLSPDIDNFVEAFEGSAVRKRFVFPENFAYNFGWTFFTNDLENIITGVDTLTGELIDIDASDYAFLLIQKINEETNEIESNELVRIASVTQNQNDLVTSSTAGGVKERTKDSIDPVIELPFLREVSGIEEIKFSESGLYDISFGIVDVGAFGFGNEIDRTSALAVWERDFGDAPFEKREYPTKFRFSTPLFDGIQTSGARYYEGEFQRLGYLKDGEHDGRPTIPANGDDIIPSPYVFSDQVDDEDGVIFGDSWVDVIFNISRQGTHNYQLRAWWDLNLNKCFDDPEHIDSTCREGNDLVIDYDLLNFNINRLPDDPTIQLIGPGLYKKRFELGFNPKAPELYSRFRLTWEPLDPDVKPFGEFFSEPDCDPNDLINCISHGEVEDYVFSTVPESSNLFSVVVFGSIGLFFMKTRKI